MALKPVVICLSKRGLAVARKAAATLDAQLHGLAGRVDTKYQFAKSCDHLRTLYAANTPIVGVCASGILIRCLAPIILEKRSEPPLVALSEDGKHVTPLLGGHRGANKIASLLAQALKASAHVTTSSNGNFGVALDQPPDGWRLSDLDRAKLAMAEIADGSALELIGNESAPQWLVELAPKKAANGKTIKVAVSENSDREALLTFHPTRFALGVGCARDCPAEELISLVEQTIESAQIAPASVAAIGSIDVKADEPAIHELAQRLSRNFTAACAGGQPIPIRLFSAQELEEQLPHLQNPSARVFAEIGCHGVAEAASLALAGKGASLLIGKQKSTNATCAIALSPHPIVKLAGKSRGRLSIVGIGPGASDWRSLESCRAIAEAEEIVGYSGYLELLGPAIAGKKCTSFPLGKETERCRYALECAAKGHIVALVCSGDAGIYAMASPVIELVDQPQEQSLLSTAARRVEINVIPGISAMQAASASAGAMLGHDFCVISLSDLLTPWKIIESRIQAAAAGDFVIAIYNPRSKTRNWQLQRAQEILLSFRPADVPVVIVNKLGREGESHNICTLSELMENKIDMLSIILVGSTGSRLCAGRRMAYTPRGYNVRADL